mmetsp:Transcript_38780/g.76861  ORF Transcript_38780/g.76861 Transcript_38780/m.76861 type:complete len:101 (-) Transcript_38780:18-320(-)
MRSPSPEPRAAEEPTAAGLVALRCSHGPELAPLVFGRQRRPLLQASDAPTAADTVDVASRLEVPVAETISGTTAIEGSTTTGWPLRDGCNTWGNLLNNIA